jgi:ATP-dependent helicase/nuclease subunit A
MVGRMVELVRAGREVDRIAAVTFTRKAAAELRERFQEALERAYATAVAAGDDVARSRFGAALDAIDRCFLGTIHAFCARLLRERPLEAGVPPQFEEISGAEEDRLRAESWTRFMERLSGRESSRLMRALGEHGLRPAQLADAFRQVADNPDVRFPAPPAPPLDPAEVAAVRRALERLLDESERLMPRAEPARGPDALQTKVRRLRFRRWMVGWDRELNFMLALEDALQGGNAVIQNRWSDDPAVKKEARALGEGWDELCAEGGRARRLIEAWWARRYRVAMRFARAAAGSYAADRLRLGALTFQDLLVRATALLRSHPEARAELGERYRWLLVDEFQDTDPVQAEMLMLLASDPGEKPETERPETERPETEKPETEKAETGAPGTGRPLWLRVRPRVGALFVVGDPKQSIYRFRRADIVVYNRVKARFREFGDVLNLVTNFRSMRPIEAFVNRAFGERFPAVESEHQAAFAPLRVRPDATATGEGVYWYRFEPLPTLGRFSGWKVSGAECELLASWIRGRIEAGRRPGDFMVLATRKSELATYARALEGHGIPVQVTGAGVLAERELAELVLLLRALADPDDAILTLAVLEGLFFGLSHQELYEFARGGGRLSLLAEASTSTSASPVREALATLRGFWQTTRRYPADVAVARILDRLGILPWAAASELGSTRAGAVVYVLDALRAAARDGASSLAEAIEVVEGALEQEVDAPLLPGETDAVRVMNLHKAKGLEAPVVVLAYPAKLDPHAVRRHIARDAAGNAVGWLRLTDPTQRGDRVIALPAGWADHEAAELPYQAGESVRRMYVAATRAAEELVVARCDRTEEDSCWGDLHPALDAPGLATELRLVASPRPEREVLGEPADAVARRIRDAAEARRELEAPSYRARPVTARVRSGAGPGSYPEPDPGAGPDPDGLPGILYLSSPEFRPAGAPAPEPRGAEWGSAVHRTLEAAGRGAEGDVLREVARAALVEFERPVHAATGEPDELDELVALVDAVRRHEVWQRVATARRVLVEAPFSFALSADEARAIGITEPAPVEILDGTIDLAFQDDDGRWTVVDFKTDARRDEERERSYERQRRLYAMALDRA